MGLVVPKACGILVSWPGIQTESPVLLGRFLAIGPQGKSLIHVFRSLSSLHFSSLGREDWAVIRLGKQPLLRDPHRGVLISGSLPVLKAFCSGIIFSEFLTISLPNLTFFLVMMFFRPGSLIMILFVVHPSRHGAPGLNLPSLGTDVSGPSH